MQVEFDDNKVTFIISFGLGSVCRNVDEIYAEFPIEEIGKYIK